nr:hypothetical protein [Tanacetum cinerariifolium]
MAKEDEEKTTFITSQGIFCYFKMPFGLKNAEATYQRLVDKAFQKQNKKNLKVYVDNLVIKSRTEQEIIRDIEETFKTLKKINMKLNPKKYTFRIEEGMFLGYKVNTKGIKLIAELPTSTATAKQEELIIYLAITKEAMSAVLMTERETTHIPIYFVSRVLQANQADLSRPEIAERMKKWNIKLERPEDEPLDTPIEAKEELSDLWTLFTDGLSCVDGFEAGLILTNPEGAEFIYALRFRFDATNNEAEYKALIVGLKIAEQMGIKNLTQAVIPEEIGMPTLRTAEIHIVQNDEALEINPDLLEEKREKASIRDMC